MFSVSIRLPGKSKFLIVLGLIAAMTFTLIVRYYAKCADTVTIPSIENEESIVLYIRSFGLEIDEDSLVTDVITVPCEFNDVYTNYNKVQQTQGFDLTAYMGKTLERYTYKVTNYPDSSAVVFAEILTYENTIVAADIYSVNADGFIKAIK